MNKEWFTAMELAGIEGLPTSKSGIIRLARRKEWISRKCETKGGEGIEYSIHSLPEISRKYLSKTQLIPKSEAAETGELEAKKVLLSLEIDQKSELIKRQEGMILALSLRGKTADRDAAKHRILAAFKAWFQDREKGLAHRGVYSGQLISEFVGLYNAGGIDIDAQARELKPRIDQASVYRWLRKLRSGQHLGGVYGHRKGKGLIDQTPELREAIVGMIAQNPHASAKIVHDFVAAKFPGRSPSRRSLERWIADWKATHAELLAAASNPDDWKNRFMSAAGSASAEIERINQRWELDSTPADVLLTDGRHSLLGCIDVATRRPKLLVAKTSKAAAVAALLRSAIVAWGVPEEIKTDNGQDYKSLHIQRACGLLDIRQNFSNPFSPWEKPHIERFFRSFSHGLCELLAGFIGHSVADRSAIEARKQFSERLFKKDEAVEIKLSGAQLQAFCDRWVNDIYLHENHAGLGTTPFLAVQAAGGVRVVEDERALDMLLAEAPGRNGLHKVGKKGVRIDGGDYAAPELALYVGQSVQVLYTEQLGEVIVYGHDRPDDPFDRHASRPGFHFICKAICPERAGISREEVAAKAREARELQKKTIQDEKRKLKSASKAAGVKDAVELILEDKRQKAAENVIAFPKAKTAHASDGLRAAEDALKAQDAEGWHPDDPRTVEGQLKVLEQARNRPKTLKLNFGSAFERVIWTFGEYMEHREEALDGESHEFIKTFRTMFPRSIKLADDTLDWKYLSRWDEYQTVRQAVGWPGTRKPKDA